MTARYSYNTQVDPPAPFVHVTISHPENETAVPDCAALLDTAADMTVVPIELIEKLGLLPVEAVLAEGLGRNVVECPAYFVNLALRNLQPYASRHSATTKSHTSCWDATSSIDSGLSWMAHGGASWKSSNATR